MRFPAAGAPSARYAIVDAPRRWHHLRSGVPSPPNTNPYVRHLLTAYSQSKQSNSGTRGLDVISEQTYVETALDRDLIPSVLSGEFSLVVISGNAGDGKTAFLQKLERRAVEDRAVVDHSLPNGARFKLRGRTFLSNYDGSQDEGDQKNDDVLRAFLAPFKGDSRPNGARRRRLASLPSMRDVSSTSSRQTALTSPRLPHS